MSIFAKDCPVCAASHPVHVVRCGCGYCFDPNKIDGVTQELEVISQEEQLYRDYLAARADQADKAMQFAKAAAAREHDNTVRVAEALLAEQAAMSARAELDAQDQRTQAVKNRIKVVRASRRARRVAKAATAPKSRPTPVSVREVMAPKPAPVPVAPPPAPAVPMQTAKAEPKPKIEHEPPKLTVVAPKPVEPKPLPPKPVAAPKPAPVITAPPPTLTKVAQPAANKQAAPVKPKPAPVVSKAPAAAPVLQNKPTPSFRASQASKVAHIAPMSAKSNSLECPNCSAKVAPTATHCRCGFEMPLSASQIPSLSLSPEERAAFQAALSPTGKSRGN